MNWDRRFTFELRKGLSYGVVVMESWLYWYSLQSAEIQPGVATSLLPIRQWQVSSGNTLEKYCSISASKPIKVFFSLYSVKSKLQPLNWTILNKNLENFFFKIVRVSFSLHKDWINNLSRYTNLPTLEKFEKKKKLGGI